MTVAKKIGTKQLKIKSGTFEKWLWRKTSEPNSVIKIKKMRLKKMIVAKKSEQSSVRLKNAPYKNDCGQKNRSKTVEKNGTLYKWLCPKKFWTKQRRIKKNVPYKNVCCQKKSEPNSAR